MRSSRFLVMFASLTVLIVCVDSSRAQTVAYPHSFTGEDGSANPFYGTLTQGKDARLYGTTYQLSGGDGSIFAFSTTGATETLLTFDGTDGTGPFGAVTLATDGNFYGTTGYGGTSNYGVLFRMRGSNLVVLHEFAGGSDGMVPVAAPIQASDGNLYGTTFGSLSGTGATIYEYEPSSGVFTTIYQFPSAQGQFIFSPLIQGTDGNLYGTASTGGARGCGTIFKLTTSGTLLFYYSFPCGLGGGSPFGPLTQGSDGDFYGTTQAGGSTENYGTVFKMSPDGKISILHAFRGEPTDGAGPNAGLAQATDGKLYGATQGGGSWNSGVLFQMTTDGTYDVLYSFPSKTAEGPETAPVQDTDGLLYGTTLHGGKFGFGTIYSLDMSLGPFVTFVQPTAPVGGTAQILGQGLTGTTSVTFNGAPATSFSVVSDTYITTVVPTGATTGPVVVTTPTGPLTSNVNFRILQ